MTDQVGGASGDPRLDRGREEPTSPSCVATGNPSGKSCAEVWSGHSNRFCFWPKRGNLVAKLTEHANRDENETGGGMKEARHFSRWARLVSEASTKAPPHISLLLSLVRFGVAGNAHAREVGNRLWRCRSICGRLQFLRRLLSRRRRVSPDREVARVQEARDVAPQARRQAGASQAEKDRCAALAGRPAAHDASEPRVR